MFGDANAFTVGGALDLGALDTSGAGDAGITLTGGGGVVGDTTFANTGGLRLGDGDSNDSSSVAGWIPLRAAPR
ncbi:MAG: hypothetical protein U5R48_14910 [Gammaproteobacteria bacterium]|nr:hypothetical protein [Gammaproteobacteria bacterium]